MQAGERFFKEVQMSLFLLLLYVALYVIMALLVWFDKRDGKGRWSKNSGAADGSAATDGSEQSSDGDALPKSLFEIFFDSLAGDWPQ